MCLFSVIVTFVDVSADSVFLVISNAVCTTEYFQEKIHFHEEMTWISTFLHVVLFNKMVPN